MKDIIEKYVGKEGSIFLNGLRVNVRCLDYKESYGKPRWLVESTNGGGKTWTEQDPLAPAK